MIERNREDLTDTLIRLLRNRPRRGPNTIHGKKQLFCRSPSLSTYRAPGFCRFVRLQSTHFRY
jgi:hypothetical protein